MNKVNESVKSIIVLLIFMSVVVGLSVLWFSLSINAAYGHTISALQMAQQQDFFKMKFAFGLVVGVLISWISIWRAIKREAPHKKTNFRTVFIDGVLMIVTFVSFGLMIWGYRGTNPFVNLSPWLPYSIAFGQGWFLGAGLLTLYYFFKGRFTNKTN